MSFESSERGTVLLMAMVLVVVVGTATMTVANRSRVTTAETGLDLGRAATLAAADGAIDTARLRLSHEPTWPGGELTIGACRVTLRCEAVEPDTWRLTATAVDPRGTTVTSTVRAELVRDDPSNPPRIVDWSEVGRARQP